MCWQQAWHAATARSAGMTNQSGIDHCVRREGQIAERRKINLLRTVVSLGMTRCSSRGQPKQTLDTLLYGVAKTCKLISDVHLVCGGL